MELMSTSFDKFYKYVYCALDDVIPEEILGKITLAVSRYFVFVISYQGRVLIRSGRPSVNVCFCSVFQQTVKALNHLKENLKIIHRGKFL